MDTYSIDAELGDGFKARLEFDADREGNPEDLDVFSAKTGESLEPLIFGARLWDEALSAAERHLNSLPLARQAIRKAQRDMRSMCFDTPYA